MIRTFIAVALALTLVPRAPAAQEAKPAEGSPPAASKAPAPSAAPRSSPAADLVARAITTQESWRETIRAYATSLASQIGAAVRAKGGDAPKDVEQRVRTGLDAAIGYEDVVRLQAQALAGRFSEDELRTIGKFYESGPGKKLLTELPVVSRQVVEVVQQRMSAAVPKIVQEVAPSLAQAQPGSGAEGPAPPPAAGKAPPKDTSKDAQGRKPPLQQAPRR